MCLIKRILRSASSLQACLLEASYYSGIYTGSARRNIRATACRPSFSQPNSGSKRWKCFNSALTVSIYGAKQYVLHQGQESSSSYQAPVPTELNRSVEASNRQIQTKKAQTAHPGPKPHILNPKPYRSLMDPFKRNPYRSLSPTSRYMVGCILAACLGLTDFQVIGHHDK